MERVETLVSELVPDLGEHEVKQILRCAIRHGGQRLTRYATNINQRPLDCTECLSSYFICNLAAHVAFPGLRNVLAKLRRCYVRLAFCGQQATVKSFS